MSMTTPLDRLHGLFGDRFQELAGTHVVGEVPLTDGVINAVIADRLAGMSAPVTGVRVRARDGDALDVDVTLRNVPLLSTVPVALRIDRQPQLPGSPVLTLHWSVAGLGALARIAAPFISRFATLPPGVRIDSDHIVVDLAEALRAQGFGDVLGLVTRLEVHTRDGRVVASFELAVASGT
jgi:hypothetical protein